MELVVLLAETGEPIGTARKYDVHTDSTPLHLAFSCWLFDDDGRVLLTRRALSKLTWPGVWTNSFCGHPAPDEAPEEAITRRAATELGVNPAELVALEVVAPDFRYRAADSSGVVENEICPVYVARLQPGARLSPNPDEVDSYAWVTPGALLTAAEATPFVFSPWMIAELNEPGLRARLA